MLQLNQQSDGEGSDTEWSKEGLFRVSPDEKNVAVGAKTRFLQDCIESDFSRDGKYVAGASSNGEFCLFSVDGNVLFKENFKDVSNIYFSRLSRFVVVTHGSGKETSVAIIRIGNLERLDRHIGFTKSQKRYVVFAGEDKVIVVQIAPNAIETYNWVKGFEATGKMDIIPSIELGAIHYWTAPLLFAHNSNCSNDNEKGTQFEIYNLETRTVHFKNFFKGLQQIDIFPNPKTSLLLLRGHKYVDDSGQSYYGKNTLDVISMDEAKKKPVTCFNGPIYNVSWNPNGDTFAVCAGIMPSHTVIYDSKANPLLEVIKDPKNSIYWSPNGEFIAIAGFGNLTGEIQIWNVPKRFLLGKCTHADAGDLEWAPDGRHFVTKVEFRFLREGNQYRVYDYHGTLKNKIDLRHTELYSVKWHPEGTMVTTPASPAPAKPKPTASLGGKMSQEEDFMADLKEKSSGPKIIKLEDILNANAGKVSMSSQPKIQQPEKKKIVGLPSDEEKKKKKKKKKKA